MKRALFVALNEVRLFIQDKGDLAFAILLPIVTFALMYGAFGGNTLFSATATVINEDNGTYSTQLIQQLSEVKGITVQKLTLADASARLDRSDLTFAFEIPAGFSAALTSGGQAELVFLQRGNGGQEGQILASIIRGIVQGLNQQFQVRAQVAANVKNTGISADRINIVVQQALKDEQLNPAVTVTEQVFGNSGNFVNQYIPGIVTMYVLFSLSLSARAIVEERKRGTLERLLTTRLNTGELFFGKFLANIGRGFIQTVILMALAYAIFRVFTPLSFVVTIFTVLVFAAAASALGMLIASIARSEDMAIWTGVVFTMAMTMLGGTFFEVAKGSVLDTVGKFSLNTYANEALRSIITNKGSLAGTGTAFAVMVGVAVVALVISRLIFRAVPGGKGK
ncbi:MAG TPA: ABC transporter permease [Dehalococcoidales bacterium]|nr:ABC transporter permease [Dehalococcoidales bacterium]